MCLEDDTTPSAVHTSVIYSELFVVYLRFVVGHSTSMSGGVSAQRLIDGIVIRDRR